jgi:predicted dehydrogenase
MIATTAADAMHASHVATALDHGLHVLGEKPLTLLAVDAFALRDRATALGRDRLLDNTEHALLAREVGGVLEAVEDLT